MNALIDLRLSTASSSEAFRFKVIAKDYLKAQGENRALLFKELTKYIRYSPNAYNLIDELVLCCTSADTIPDRLESAVDVLHQFGAKICDYTWQYLIRDIRNYRATYGERAYKPNDDYWHVLLKSVAGSSVDPNKKVKIIGACKEAASRSMKEIVIESLDEVDHENARMLIRRFTDDEDSFIRSLANEVLG